MAGTKKEKPDKLTEYAGKGQRQQIKNPGSDQERYVCEKVEAIFYLH
jgi:hypothetical protein